MFIDLAGFILRWRIGNGSDRYPPESEMRDYLNVRGWTAPRGGKVSYRAVQEMMRFMADDQKAFPPTRLDRIAVDQSISLPGTEIGTVAIKPDDWADFGEAVSLGWSPSWRDRTIKDDSGAA